MAGLHTDNKAAFSQKYKTTHQYTASTVSKYVVN